VKLWDLAMALRPLELVLMVAIFIGLAWRAWSPRRRRQYEEDAMIPLRDDHAEERR
jgi:cbb3-type cytochrome oxidase subunit 3